jgi:hypothetical protein
MKPRSARDDVDNDSRKGEGDGDDKEDGETKKAIHDKTRGEEGDLAEGSRKGEMAREQRRRERGGE